MDTLTEVPSAWEPISKDAAAFPVRLLETQKMLPSAEDWVFVPIPTKPLPLTKRSDVPAEF